MFQENHIKKLLNIKDRNIHFYENFCFDCVKKGKNYEFINAHLSYIPICCPKCGVAFGSNFDYEKKGFKMSTIVVPSIFKMDTYLLLNK